MVAPQANPHIHSNSSSSSSHCKRTVRPWRSSLRLRRNLPQCHRGVCLERAASRQQLLRILGRRWSMLMC